MLRSAPYIIAFCCLIGNLGDTSSAAVFAAVAQAFDDVSPNIRQPLEIVLLTNGQTLQGRVTRAAESVTVRMPGGSRIVVPASQVDRCCDSFEEAYQRRVGKLPASDFAGHESLLHWCLKHRLESAAHQQLTTLMQTKLSVRRLSYLDQRIRSTFAPAPEPKAQLVKITTKQPSERSSDQFSALPMLSNAAERTRQNLPDAGERYASTDSHAFTRRTHAKIGPTFAMRPKTVAFPMPAKSAASPAETTELKDNRVQPVTYAEPIVRSPAKPTRSLSANELDSMTRRMPKNERHQFQRRIQPILLRGCNAVKCHAPTDAAMPLMQRGRGQLVPKRMSQRNLSEALALINADSPETSPLLVAATLAHGAAEKPALKPDSKDYVLLKAWVRAVAANAPDLLPDPKYVSSSLEPHATKPVAGVRKPVAGVQGPAGASQEPVKEAPPLSADHPADSTPSQPADPFDPELFNRR